MNYTEMNVFEKQALKFRTGKTIDMLVNTFDGEIEVKGKIEDITGMYSEGGRMECPISITVKPDNGAEAFGIDVDELKYKTFGEYLKKCGDVEFELCCNGISVDHTIVWNSYDCKLTNDGENRWEKMLKSPYDLSIETYNTHPYTIVTVTDADTDVLKQCRNFAAASAGYIGDNVYNTLFKDENRLNGDNCYFNFYVISFDTQNGHATTFNEQNLDFTTAIETFNKAIAESPKHINTMLGIDYVTPRTDLTEQTVGACDILIMRDGKLNFSEEYKNDIILSSEKDWLINSLIPQLRDFADNYKPFLNDQRECKLLGVEVNCFRDYYNTDGETISSLLHKFNENKLEIYKFTGNFKKISEADYAYAEQHGQRSMYLDIDENRISVFDKFNVIYAIDEVYEVKEIVAETTEQKRINQGYEIIKSEVVGESEIVLGYNEKANQYVTWDSSVKYPDDYYYGHYFPNNDKNTALKDFHTRCADKCELYKEMSQTPQEQQESVDEIGDEMEM